ncbi:MAG: LamG-like jellyroll fold domain-containing protein [Thermoguttaceae bacterium]
MPRILAVTNVLAAVVALVPFPCRAGERSVPPMYRKEASLQETLLATRAAYAAWQAEQSAARNEVQFAPWRGTPLLPAAEADKRVQPGAAMPVDQQLPDGRPLWTEQAGLADGKVAPYLAGNGDQAAWLARSVHATRACRLTIGAGAGDRLDVWLGGEKLASAATHLNVDRYGTGTRVDGTRVDQLLVDLPLEAGDNTLLVRITPGSEPSFSFNAAADPVPRLWEEIGRDFSAADHPLLEQVHADWFGPLGWLAAEDCRWERQYLDGAVDRCGPDGAAIGQERQQLEQESVPRSDRRWLDLCVRASVLASLRTQLARLRAAVDELGRSASGDYSAADLLGQLDRYEQRLSAAATELDPARPATRELMAELARLQRQILVDENPLLKHMKIVFVRRYTYNSKHYYDDFQHVSRWGGNLCELSLADGKVRTIAPELEGGVFDRYDLSFDARHIVFGYRRPRPEGYRIYEIGVDGSGLRQVTHPPDDEADRIATYRTTSTGDSFYGLLGYQFWTDDVHPCYLPDGGLCLASTRSQHGVLCTASHYLACTNLFRVERDGSRMRPLSQGALSEFTPTVMDDGRILYNRWEYVYKGIAAVQPLWTMRPDGSGGEEFYGDNITDPGVFWQARQLPGLAGKAVCIGCSHEPLGIGQVLLLDPAKSKRTPAGMTSLTPDVETRGLRGLYQRRNGVWREDVFGPFYADPYPLSDKFFLVACNPDRRYNDQAAYGIYLLDAFGNRVLLHAEKDISCWQPMPLRPRKTPPILPRQPEAERPATATLLVGDVYRGLDGVEPGTVKYLRVMEQVPKPWAAEIDPLRGQDRTSDGYGGHLAVSRDAHIWVSVLRGIVPVEADGSVCLEVPAGKNLFFQALDKDFMQVQRMRTFVNLEPGETRSCIGCHEHRTQAPPARLASAATRTAARLGPQPGETAPRPLDYAGDVQPMLDRHCAPCHTGNTLKAPPDLGGELTTFFNRSYENLLKDGWVNTVREWNGMDHAMNHAEAVAPYEHGSHASKVVKLLRAGHYECRLSQEEWIRLVTWIDCGAPYYGSYYGRRNLSYRGQPDFRPAPTVDSACGIPPEFARPVTPEPIPAELLAWWPLDGNAGGADAGSVDAAGSVETDRSGHGHDLKAAGAGRDRGHDGLGGRRFDGSGYLESEGLGAHEAISIALWVKAGQLSNRWNPLLFCHEGQPGAVHFSLLDDGRPNVAVNTGDWNWTHCTGERSLADGAWHHLALVCDARFGGKARFYVDGQPAGEAWLGLGIALDLYRFRIGAWNRWEKQPTSNFHGQIDDLRIYRGTLLDQEIAALARP